MRSTFRIWIGLTLCASLMLATRAPACVGDCDGDATVAINELISAVRIALGNAELATCDAIDNNRDGAATVNELVRGVGKGLDGCGLGSPDETLLSTSSPGLMETDLGSGRSFAIDPTAVLAGQPCLLPGASGEYVVADSTGFDATPPVTSSLSVYAADGTFLRRLPLPPELTGFPRGCAVDAAGRLFATFSERLLPRQLAVYFPPDYIESCVVDASLAGAGAVAVDAAGSVYSGEFGDGDSLVVRFAPPFPSSAAECGSVSPTKSTFIDFDAAFAIEGLASGRGGHWFIAYTMVDEETVSTGIREHDADGAFIREVLPPSGGGAPLGMAFDANGVLYYADRGNGASGTGTLRRVAFDPGGDPQEPELIGRGLDFPGSVAIVPSRQEWLTLGGSVRRTYFNPREHVLTRDTVSRLIPKWKYPTSGMISAQPIVTWVDLPGEGRTQIVIASSWDRTVYALRTENGSQVWRYQRKPQPGTFYPFAGTPTVAWIDGQQRVYVPGGETMYCLDATTGEEIWQFDAGTGCTTCTPRQERNQIESTPAVVDGLVYFGMDINDSAPGKGGVLALDAVDGRLVWWFDLMTLTTCRPFAEDDVRRFDGYHSEADLGLPPGFFATRPGCDFDRYQYACGNVWSSPAVDLRRGLLYTASSNCDTDDDPETAPLPPPMRPYDEALFALTLAGDPAWVWRPREVDNDDLSFGAVPNLFEAEIEGELREVVGIGGKDGTYYLLDRDGVNELTGVIEPYWSRNVVPGGPIGGIIGSASVGEGVITFQSGFGTSITIPQKPAVHALDPSDGSILWQNSAVDTGYCPAMGVPGLSIFGGTPRPNLNFFSRADGELLREMLVTPVPSGIAAAATIVGGQVFSGAGTGAFNEGSDANREANRDTPLSAFCVEGAPGCVPVACSDGNACTYDYRDRTGACVSEPGAEGLDCRVGTVPGRCQAGICAELPD